MSPSSSLLNQGQTQNQQLVCFKDLINSQLLEKGLDSNVEKRTVIEKIEKGQQVTVKRTESISDKDGYITTKSVAYAFEVDEEK